METCNNILPQWSSSLYTTNSINIDTSYYNNDEDQKDMDFVCEDFDNSTDNSTLKISMGDSGRSRTWTLGRLSCVMLLLFSLTDVLQNLVDAQMDSLEAQDHYDSLSADVIRPAFRYHASSDRYKKNQPLHSSKPRMGLGSAAISSVTTALSPILPFTGGLDLRRQDYWTDGWLGSVASVAQHVRNAFNQNPSARPSDPTTLLDTRGGAKVAVSKANSRKYSRGKATLGNSEPFVSLKDIAKLTLKDVSLALRFAVENTRSDFSLSKFLSSSNNHNNNIIKQVLNKMADAVSTSRGKGIQAPITGRSEHISGDVDALHFCAAMRVFAEWRMLRQVPDGYKGYAVGMSLGQKDIVQNVAKIEKAIHEWIDHQATTSTPDDAVPYGWTSPTLRDLLQYEADSGVHEKLPRLKEKSAAMGLLWVRRQLHYQTALFANVIQVPDHFATAKDAISAAYTEVYDRYHGWAVQKIFSYSFKAAPDTSEVYKVMNPEKFREVQQEAQSIVLEDEASNNSKRRMPSHDESQHPLDRLGRHVHKEWNKMANAVGAIFSGNGDARSSHSSSSAEWVRGGSESAEETSLLALRREKFIKDQMELDAREHIRSYLQIAQPILEDLSQLFEELNMDDPTKV